MLNAPTRLKRAHMHAYGSSAIGNMWLSLKLCLHAQVISSLHPLLLITRAPPSSPPMLLRTYAAYLAQDRSDRLEWCIQGSCGPFECNFLIYLRRKRPPRPRLSFPEKLQVLVAVVSAYELRHWQRLQRIRRPSFGERGRDYEIGEREHRRDEIMRSARRWECQADLADGETGQKLDFGGESRRA